MGYKDPRGLAPEREKSKGNKIQSEPLPGEDFHTFILGFALFFAEFVQESESEDVAFKALLDELDECTPKGGDGGNVNGASGDRLGSGGGNNGVISGCSDNKGEGNDGNSECGSIDPSLLNLT